MDTELLKLVDEVLAIKEGVFGVADEHCEDDEKEMEQ